MKLSFSFFISIFITVLSKTFSIISSGYKEPPIETTPLVSAKFVKAKIDISISQ